MQIQFSILCLLVLSRLYSDNSYKPLIFSFFNAGEPRASSMLGTGSTTDLFCWCCHEHASGIFSSNCHTVMPYLNHPFSHCHTFKLFLIFIYLWGEVFSLASSRPWKWTHTSSFFLSCVTFPFCLFCLSHSFPIPDWHGKTALNSPLWVPGPPGLFSSTLSWTEHL